MLKYVNGDLVKDKKYTVFCHQVNCIGVMGAGIAKQIRDAYPEVYRNYKQSVGESNARIGTNLYIHTSDNRTCVNMFAQYNYGRDEQYTDYTAFRKCLTNLKNYAAVLSSDTIIAFPYGIGCGNGGGKWDIIESMLKHFAHEVKQEVYIVKK